MVLNLKQRKKIRPSYASEANFQFNNGKKSTKTKRKKKEILLTEKKSNSRRILI